MHNTTALAFGVLLISAGACKPASPTTPLANALSRTDAVDDLALIPAQVSFVIHVDVDTLRASPIYAQLVTPQLARNPELALVKTACGFDPLAQVTSLTFAAVGGMADPDGAVELIVHGIPRDPTLACLPKLPATLDLHQDHDTWVMTSGQRPMALRFVSDSVALVAIGPTASQAGTDGLIAGRASALSSSASFVEMKAKLHAANWFVTTPPAVLDLVGMNGILAAFGSVDLGDGLALDATMQFDTGANAERAARDLKKPSPELASFNAHFDIVTTGANVRITAKVDRDNLVGAIRLMSQ